MNFNLLITVHWLVYDFLNIYNSILVCDNNIMLLNKFIFIKNKMKSKKLKVQ